MYVRFSRIRSIVGMTSKSESRFSRLQNRMAKMRIKNENRVKPIFSILNGSHSTITTITDISFHCRTICELLIYLTWFLRNGSEASWLAVNKRTRMYGIREIENNNNQRAKNEPLKFTYTTNRFMSREWMICVIKELNGGTTKCTESVRGRGKRNELFYFMIWIVCRCMCFMCFFGCFSALHIFISLLFVVNQKQRSFSTFHKMPNIKHCNLRFTNSIAWYTVIWFLLRFSPPIPPPLRLHSRRSQSSFSFDFCIIIITAISID